MHLRNTRPRKHVHAWSITKRSPPGYLMLRLQRSCSGCGEHQYAIEYEPKDLPPEPLLALAELTWWDGKL